MKLGKILSEIDDEDLSKMVGAFREEGKWFVDQVILRNSAFDAELGDQGRITVPSATRRKLDLEKGDLVQVFIRKVEPEE